MYKFEPKYEFQPLQLIRDYQSDPEGNVIVIDPFEDFPAYVPEEDHFTVGERVKLKFPADDGSMWESLGTILELDLDDGYQYILLLVQVDWNTAAPLHAASQ